MTSNGRFVDTEQRPLKTWRQVHEESAPLLLPVAHDALTAKVGRASRLPGLSDRWLCVGRVALRLAGYRPCPVRGEQ